MANLPSLPDDINEPMPMPAPAEAAQAAGRGTPRLRVPNRDQVQYSWSSLDERLDPDSQARVVWELVCRLDLDAWLVEIKAIERHVGRDATDPRLLIALWVFATLKGIGSRTRAGTPLQGPPRLSVALRRRLGELPHARRLPLSGRREVG